MSYHERFLPKRVEIYSNAEAENAAADIIFEYTNEGVVLGDEKLLAYVDRGTICNIIQFSEAQARGKKPSLDLELLATIAEKNIYNAFIMDRSELYATETFARVRDVLLEPILPKLKTLLTNIPEESQLLCIGRSLLDAKGFENYVNFMNNGGFENHQSESIFRSLLSELCTELEQEKIVSREITVSAREDYKERYICVDFGNNLEIDQRDRTSINNAALELIKQKLGFFPGIEEENKAA